MEIVKGEGLHTVANEIAQHPCKQGTLFIAPKVCFEDMLQVFGCVDLDHAAEEWERDGPDRSELVVLLLQELVQLLTVDGGHERHVAKEGDGALWLFEVSSTASANGVGAILEDIEGYDSGHELEAVLASGKREQVLIEGGECSSDGHDGKARGEEVTRRG